jgi:hypothetical protein
LKAPALYTSPHFTRVIQVADIGGEVLDPVIDGRVTKAGLHKKRKKKKKKKKLICYRIPDLSKLNQNAGYFKDKLQELAHCCCIMIDRPLFDMWIR